MKVVGLEAIIKNENSKLEMSQDMQDLLRTGGCLYIIYSRYNLQSIHLNSMNQIAKNNPRMNQMDQQKHKDRLDIPIFPNNVQNVAMLYYNLFYLKRAYINYDREIVLGACMMVAAKT